MSVRKIAEVVKIGKSTVSRIINMDNKLCHFKPNRKGKCGRKRKTTPYGDKIIFRNSVKDPKKTSTDLQKDLAKTGVVIDASTVRKKDFLKKVKLQFASEEATSYNTNDEKTTKKGQPI